ncbi:hypothetical protein PAMP_018212 [Pampus punctatissimus]
MAQRVLVTLMDQVVLRMYLSCLFISQTVFLTFQNPKWTWSEEGGDEEEEEQEEEEGGGRGGGGGGRLKGRKKQGKGLKASDGGGRRGRRLLPEDE